MTYLKITNCPLSNCLIKKTGSTSINWDIMGFVPMDISRTSIQGNTEVVNGKAGGDFITLLPISDEAKFETVKQEILDNINNNSFENDSAEVVEQSVYDADKIIIDTVKAEIKTLTAN